jgi:hypothetical protein
VIIPIIQILGVFIASLFGLASLIRGIAHLSVSSANTIAFALGMAMATCGLFF